MSQWQHVCNLCRSSKEFHQRLSEFYGKVNFPIKIRIMHSAWLEEQTWSFDTNYDEGKRQAECLLNELLTLIQTSIEETRSEQPYERTMELEVILSNLRKSFDSDARLFVDVIRQCLNEERSLIDSFSNETVMDSAQVGAVQQCKARENLELIQTSEAVRRRIDEASAVITEVDKHQEAFMAEFKKKAALISVLRSQSGYGGMSVDEARVKCDNLQAEVAHLTQLNQARRNNMGETQINVAIDVARLIKLIWSEISQWQKNERKVITGLSTSLEGALDNLDKLCNIGGELLYRMIGQIENAIGLCDKLLYQVDPMKLNLEKVLQELRDDYLPSFLRRAFVVEQNVPDQMLKIAGNKSANFSMSVRLLGGTSLGLGFTKPRVKMCVFYEAEVPKTDEYKDSQYEVENGSERPFVVNNTCVAHFNTVRLKNCKKACAPKYQGAGINEKLVTEQKYAAVFYTVISICGQKFNIRAVSLPIIFISQTSQEVMAKGTLIWDAAFSDENREPYKYREQVSWVEVASVLNALFTAQTGRGLNEHHLRYLAKMAFRIERDDVSDFGAYEISEKQVIKDKLEGRDFSFWKWFWCCTNLIKDYVRQEWNDGLIYGFISKEDAKAKLINQECGTFLLRFSEGSIETCKRAAACGYLTLAVIEKDPATGQKKLFHVRDYLEAKEIRAKNGLGMLLDAMEVIDYDHQPQKKKLLTYLWPDTDRHFRERFPFEKPDPKGSDAYTSAKIIIEIFLGTQPMYESVHRQESAESQDNSFSCANSPAFSSTSEEPNLLENLQPEPWSKSKPVLAVIPTVPDHAGLRNLGLTTSDPFRLPGVVFPYDFDTEVDDIVME